MALEFKDYDKDESAVSAAVVTDDDGVDVPTIGGTVVHADKDSVVVATERPGVYDVHSKDTWNAIGYNARYNAGA